MQEKYHERLYSHNIEEKYIMQGLFDQP